MACLAQQQERVMLASLTVAEQNVLLRSMVVLTVFVFRAERAEPVQTMQTAVSQFAPTKFVDQTAAEAEAHAPPVALRARYVILPAHPADVCQIVLKRPAEQATAAEEFAQTEHVLQKTKYV